MTGMGSFFDWLVLYRTHEPSPVYCNVAALPVKNGDCATGGESGTRSGSTIGSFAIFFTMRKQTNTDNIPNSTAPRPQPAMTPIAP